MVRRPGDAPCLVSYHKPDDSNLAGVSGLIYHIARRADWERARADGEYTRSTADKTLAEEGFIHASQAPQVAGTANKFYRDVPGGLVLLVIDPGLLRAEVRYEDVPGTALPAHLRPAERRRGGGGQALRGRGGRDVRLHRGGVSCQGTPDRRRGAGPPFGHAVQAYATSVPGMRARPGNARVPRV
jgi:glutathione S-transferase